MTTGDIPGERPRSLDTLSRKTALERVKTDYVTSTSLLRGIYLQAKEKGISSAELNPIIRKATAAFKQSMLARKEELRKLPAKLSSEDIKELKGISKGAVKDSTKILREVQLQILVALTQHYTTEEMDEKKLQKLVEGLEKGKLVARIRAPKHLKTAYKIARTSLQEASTLPFAQIAQTTTVEEEIAAEFKRDAAASLKQRTGVVGLRSMYRVAFETDEAKIKKQMKSLYAHQVSQKERTTMEQRLMLRGGRQVTKRLIPINAEFDDHVANTGARIFGRIFGTKGLSSFNRMERHLINGWISEIETPDKKPVMEVLRHAILAEKLEATKKERKETSRKMAGELLSAAALMDLRDRDLSVERAAERKLAPKLHFVSISLVSPDVARPMLGKVNERRMLADQVKGLRHYDGATSVEIDPTHSVPVELDIAPFNFGVNVIVKGRGALTVATDTARRQYAYNKAARKKLNAMVDEFIEAYDKYCVDFPELTDASVIERVKQIRDDINFLTKNWLAYLTTGNQYECQGRIIHLMNTMDNAMKPLKQVDDLAPGYKVALNCMSDKDRSGILDAVASTQTTFAEEMGRYVTAEELMTKPELTERYLQILQSYLKSINIDITSINSDVKGYKVKDEALITYKYGPMRRLMRKLRRHKPQRICGLDPEAFKEIQGFSKTTSG